MGDINSTNIQAGLARITAFTLPAEINTTALANSIAGNQNANNDKIDVGKLTADLNALAKSNPVLLSQIVDFMSKEGGADEFFTTAGLTAFRTALRGDKPIVDAFNIAKSKNSDSADTATDVISINSSETAINAHLRSMLGVTTTPGASDVLVADNIINNLERGVSNKLAASWCPSNMDVEAYKNTPEFKQRVGFLALAFKGSTDKINNLLRNIKVNSELFKSLTTALDSFMTKFNSNDNNPISNFFRGAGKDEELSTAWKSFVGLMSSKSEVNGEVLTKLENVSPKFLIAFGSEISKKSADKCVEWVVNMIFDNGFSNMMGKDIPKDAKNGEGTGYKSTEFSKASNSFLDFVSGGTGQKFQFKTEEQIANHQNIFGENASSAFWDQHKSLRALYAQSYPKLGDKALMDKYLIDLSKKGIIKIDDMHNYLLKRDEKDKLEAIVHIAAGKIETEYDDDKKPTIDKILDEPVVKALCSEKARLYDTSKDALPKNVEVKDVNQGLGMFQIAEKKATAETKLRGLGIEADITKYLMDIYYYTSVSISGNKRYNSTMGETAAKAAERVARGIEYISGKEFAKDGKDENIGKYNLTKSQKVALLKAMALDDPTTAATGPGGAPGGASAGGSPFGRLPGMPPVLGQPSV